MAGITRHWRRWMVRTIAVAAMMLTGGCESLFFYPSPHLVLTPARGGLAYRDVWFKTADDVRLHGWFLPAEGDAPARGNILFFHGNAQNISGHIGAVAGLPARGFNVLLFDYRGYGQSEGQPSIAGVNRDGLAAINFAFSLSDVDRDRWVVFGQSLGGTVAITSVARSIYRSDIRGLISESAFASYRGIFREKAASIWFTAPFGWPLSPTIASEYDPVDFIADLTPMPVLIINGIADNIVPVDNARELYDAARQPKTLWLIPDAGHIASLTEESGRDRFVAWVEKVLESR